MIYVYHIIIGLLFSIIVALLSYIYGYYKGYLDGCKNAKEKEPVK